MSMGTVFLVMHKLFTLVVSLHPRKVHLPALDSVVRISLAEGAIAHQPFVQFPTACGRADRSDGIA